MSAKRNLVLGILALKSNFINRSQLLAAFNAWVEDKSRPLGDLLVQQQALKADEHALLEALAAKHLDRHEQDSDKSLAALSSVGSAHRHLAKIADADVQESLVSLAVAQQALPVPSDEVDPYATVSTEDYPGIPGRFRILRPHAAGGLGKVSVALDQELKREVALKEIKEQHADNRDARSRFVLEAEITGALEHPGIVPVYSLGTYADGRPFYAMRFIRGDSLKEAIHSFHNPKNPLKPRGEFARPDFHSLAFRKLLGRFVDVCNAIAYAHSRGVLHRDLKPGNIMLGKYGETLVVDWGLAKAGVGEPSRVSERVEDEESLLRPGSASGSSETLPGSALGTPAYMSPEQAAGRIDLLGPPSDVYSLGATLYHLLTGKVPFDGRDSVEILKKVKAGDFLPPCQVHFGIEPALEIVCLKAMSLRPTDRYVSARDLADELDHWLANEDLRKVHEEIKVAYAKLAESEVEARASAEAERQAREHAEDLLATSTMMLAKSRLEEGHASLAHDLLDQVSAKYRLSSWGLLKNYLAGSLFTFGGHADVVNCLAFAADGHVLASASRDNTVKLWDARTGQELRTLRGHTREVTSLAFAADGQVLATASADAAVKLWDARTGQELHTLRGHNYFVTSVAFTANGQVLATASADAAVKLWDARTGQELRALRGHMDGVTSIAFAADGQVLASASADMTVKLWDARTGQELRTLYGHTGIVTSVTFAAGGQALASASWDKTVKLWDARTGQELRSLHGHTGEVTSVAFAADGLMLASASHDSTAKLWDARTGQELRTLHGHMSIVTSVAFAADGQLLASASADMTVKLWDARTGQELRSLLGHATDVTSVAFAADGQILASANWDKTIKLRDIGTGQELRTLRGHTLGVTGVAFAVSGQMLASASHDKTVKLWDARTGQELHTLRGHTSDVMSVAFAVDGQMVASASRDKTVKLWDARTGQELHTLRGHTDWVTSAAFTADGHLLASASHDNRVRVWDARTGKWLRTLRGHAREVASVAFAARTQVLASASWDKTVKLWDARTGQELRTLRSHTNEVTSVAFAADGQVLATSSADMTVKLWDARTGQELRTLCGHTDVVTSVAFSADGQVLASASSDGTVKMWDVRTNLEPEAERRFRLWVTAPDLHLHRELGEQADKDKQPLVLAFRLGRYIAGKNYYAAEPKEAAMLTGWLGTAAQPPGRLPGLPVLVKSPFHEPTFPDGIACTGVLYKDSGIAPERLLIGTSRALAGDPSNWLNHVFHGGALLRSGEHAKALAALTEAARLHGKPSPLTHNLLALVSLAMGQKEKSQGYLQQAQPAKDAPWEDAALHRLFQPEVEVALAKGDGKQQSPKEK